MGELKRILRDETSPLGRRMLRAGACEQPTLRTRCRMAQAIGLSPLIAYTSAAKALISSWSVQAGLGIALAAGVATLGENDAPPSEPAASSAGPQSATAQTAIPVVEQEPSAAPVAIEQRLKASVPVPAAAPQERNLQAPSASSKRATTKPGKSKPGKSKPGKSKPGKSKPGKSKPGKSKLAIEIALIDRARTLVANGRADRALLVLDRHRNTFPRGVLAPEAELLRRRALE